MINIDNILKYSSMEPKSENEMLVCLSALTLLNALVKTKEYGKLVTYSQIKPNVARLINYALAQHNLKLLDGMYIDTVNKKSNCLFVRCLGVQFSYHSIPIYGQLRTFVNSMDNIYMVYDKIRKQPKALGVFNLAVECMNSHIDDKEFINKEIEKLDYDFPEVLNRKNKAVEDSEPINMDNKDEIMSILSGKYKVNKI